MTRTERFPVLPGGSVEISGDDGALRHFEKEYGAAEGTVPPRVSITIADRLPEGVHADLGGAHKTVRWLVSLGPADERPLRATIALRGRPRWFAVSLIQGYMIEPLLSLAAPAAGHVLLPSAAICEEGGALLIIGRSRSGKSSVSMRALAVGRRVLGDDQVLVGLGGVIHPFPRRMRVYDDLMETSASAFAALPAGVKLSLRVRRVVRIASRGFVAPSLALPHGVLGPRDARTPVPLRRIVVVRRSAEATAIRTAAMAPDEALLEAGEILDEQRSRLSVVQRNDWRELLRSIAARERAMLAATFGRTPVARVTVPESWGAAMAVSELARMLDIG